MRETAVTPRTQKRKNSNAKSSACPCIELSSLRKERKRSDANCGTTRQSLKSNAPIMHSSTTARNAAAYQTAETISLEARSWCIFTGSVRVR